MSRARTIAGVVLAYVVALGASVACAAGDEKVDAKSPPVDDSNRPLEAGVADAPEKDATIATPNGCSEDGFCYVPVPTDRPLIAVSASSADEAWMLPQQSGAILRWNGTSIEQLYEYDGASPSSITFGDLWAGKKDDVWAVATDSENHFFFVHYAARSGGVPSFRELPTQEALTAISAVWGTADGNALWIATADSVLRVREDASGAVIEELRPSLGPDDEHGYAWRGVWGFGPDDVFVAGKVCPSNPCGWEGGQGAIAHYDGATWSISTIDSAEEVTSLRGTPPGTTRQLWYDTAEQDPPGTFVQKAQLVTVTSDGQLGAQLYTHPTNGAACSTRLGRAPSATVGWFSSGSLLCRWDGAKLAPARTSVGDRPVIHGLNGIWAGGTDDVWLVGAAVTREGLPQGAIAARRTRATAQATEGGKQ